MNDTGIAELTKMTRVLSEIPQENEQWRKNIVSWDILDRLISTCDSSLVGIRDKALLYFAFASGNCSRSLLASVTMEDLVRVTGGYVYKPRTCADQESNDVYFTILRKAGKALGNWFKESRITNGKVFRDISSTGKIAESISDQTVEQILETRAVMIGHVPDVYKVFSPEAARMMCTSTTQLRPLNPMKSHIKTRKGY